MSTLARFQTCVICCLTDLWVSWIESLPIELQHRSIGMRPRPCWWEWTDMLGCQKALRPDFYCVWGPSINTRDQRHYYSYSLQTGEVGNFQLIFKFTITYESLISLQFNCMKNNWQFTLRQLSNGWICSLTSIASWIYSSYQCLCYYSVSKFIPN